MKSEIKVSLLLVGLSAVAFLSGIKIAAIYDNEIREYNELKFREKQQ